MKLYSNKFSPNAKRVRELKVKGNTAPFDGFHLAAKPKVLE